jgi:integrase
MKALTHDEVLKVLKATDDKRNLAMILGYRHGMRASEVCRLEMKDIDLKNGDNYSPIEGQLEDDTAG